MASFEVLGQTPITAAIKSLFTASVTPRRLAYISNLLDLLTVLNSQNQLTRTNLDRLKQQLPVSCDDFVEERYSQLLQPLGDCSNRYANMTNVERSPPPTAPLAASVLRNNATYYDTASPSLSLSHHHQRPVQQHNPSMAPVNVYCPPGQSEHQQHHIFTSSKKAIYAMIAEEIGKQWRNLGRELGVSEGRLDEIDDEHHGNTANKVHAMLWQFERRTVGPTHQYETLQMGLRQVRRRDMVQRMEAIFLSSLRMS